MNPEKAKFFVPENEDVTSRREHLSPSGRYKLVTSSYGTKPGCWNYSQGKVYRVGSDEPLAVINRNYSAFPFAWVEGHPKGDFFVGGEDYQGQTVVDLLTGKRRDHLSKGTESGHGFCWAAYRYEPSAQVLVVDGCHWACPYEFRFYDFSDPMQGWPEIEPENLIDADEKEPVFDADGTIKTFETKEPDEDGLDREVRAIKTFRREGLKLVLLDEWVSDAEKQYRIEYEEGQRKYDAWLANFHATDPLYLAMREGLKDSAFKPEDYEGIGVTYASWCPDFKGDERRMCKRIMKSGPVKLDLEWGTETAPVKLVVFKDGKHVEDKWFDHSVAGVQAAFSYAKAVLS